MDHVEIEETEKIKAIKCLRLLRNLLTDDIKLKSPIHDERFLIRFVRARKYDAVAAHKCVRKYFRLRRKFSHMFDHAYPTYEPVRACLESNAVVKLKQDDPEGRHILLINSKYWDLEKFNFDHVAIALTLIMDELSEVAQTKGIIILNDKEGFTSQHAKTYRLFSVRGLMQVFQGAVPISFKGMYIFREKKIVEVLTNIIKTVLSEKMTSRIHMYGSEFDEVINMIGPERLPKSIGGNLSEEEAFDIKFQHQLFARDAYYRGLSEYGFGEGCSDEEDTYM